MPKVWTKLRFVLRFDVIYDFYNFSEVDISKEDFKHEFMVG